MTQKRPEWLFKTPEKDARWLCGAIDQIVHKWENANAKERAEYESLKRKFES